MLGAIRAAAIMHARCVLSYERFSNLEKVENMLQSRQRHALKGHVDQRGRGGYYRLGIRNLRANGPSGFCSVAAAQQVVGGRQQERKTSVRLAPCTGEAGLGGKGAGQCPPTLPLKDKVRGGRLTL